MPHSFVPLSTNWPDEPLKKLVREAAGMPDPEPGADIFGLPWAELAAARVRFMRGLLAARINTRQGAYVAVWLNAEVEAEVDAAWQAAPEMGFWLHALARSLCVVVVQDMVPATAAFGCAPVPKSDPDLAVELRQAGMDCREPGAGAPLLSGRRYAVITPDPFPGGCGACALVLSCPGKTQRNST